MARNDDRARQRRNKRRGENPEGEAPEPVDGSPVDGEAAADAGEPGDSLTPAISDTQRAENEAREGITGTPIDFAKPDEPTPHTDFDPPEGGLVVGGEKQPVKKGGPRFVQFLRASWAELQRVIWPNRQQVAQGTAVTLGFVVIAGIYLGVADVIARQIVNFII